MTYLNPVEHRIPARLWLVLGIIGLLELACVALVIDMLRETDRMEYWCVQMEQR